MTDLKSMSSRRLWIGSPGRSRFRSLISSCSLRKQFKMKLKMFQCRGVHSAAAEPSPGGAHTQQLPVAQGNQAIQQEERAALAEEELGVALLVVQGTQQDAGPPQFGGGDQPARVGGVLLLFSRQHQKLTVLTEPLLLPREGDKRPQPRQKVQRDQ